MEIRGEEHIAASPDAVWRTLNDTTLLIDCIPGCEKLERISEHLIEATIVVHLSLIKLRFHGRLILSNLNPPYSYTIAGEGEGSVSGLATGKTDVSLVADGDGTILSYVMYGSAEGKIAKLGSALLAGVARKIADKFFANVSKVASTLPNMNLVN
ncbi:MULTISPECIES: CoxG family protein [unclassified Bartonella]|uniref:CoxG family protein n=1 Tax=unclassified Bartonella TaxID=2645622 RepID=UPI0015FBBFA0|nr:MULTISPECIES: carbon monoxide dehydrogenase subunit G [unclassified Bartonella]UXN04064.1 carbon monoxide dehydrogenase subunit G [Bartonella sp. HY406]UXN07050.1 carbon monoxide dehydrogenase subunit G [Bartonella sp. HY761]